MLDVDRFVILLEKTSILREFFFYFSRFCEIV